MSVGATIPLLRLYDFMRSMSGEERLEFAHWISEKPHLFNEWCAAQPPVVARFSNVDEAFHPPRPDLPPADTVREIDRGYDVAVLSAVCRAAVGGRSRAGLS